jgi:hypothetical protein
MPCRRIGSVSEYRRLALEIASQAPGPRRHGICGDDRNEGTYVMYRLLEGTENVESGMHHGTGER